MDIGKEREESSQKEKQQQHPHQQPASASTSPSHEFSFTISLNPPVGSAIPADKSKPSSQPPPSIAVDLSPADDIFFHGHLLPLQLLSNLPVSPRSSTNSMDSFTLPIRELIRSDGGNDNSDGQNKNYGPTSTSSGKEDNAGETTEDLGETKGRTKSKTFSLFDLSKWRKGNIQTAGHEQPMTCNEEKEKRQKLSDVLKKYIRMVLSFPAERERRRRRRRSNMQLLHRQAYSFSGNLSWRSGNNSKQELMRGKRLEFSAPASMRTSPTNSGLLVATAGAHPTSSSDSTMEELQAAIQAAIAHCKKSIAMEEDKIIKCHD